MPVAEFVALPNPNQVGDQGPLPPREMRAFMRTHKISLLALAVWLSRDGRGEPCSRTRLRNHKNETAVMPWRFQERAREALEAIVRDRERRFRQV